MFKHIMVALRNNEDCVVLKSAMEMARECGSQITVLHVVDRLPFYSTAFESEFDSLILETYGRALVAECEFILKEGHMRGDVRMVKPPIFEAAIGHVIADFAHQIGADLVMLGHNKSRGWRFWKRSVSKEVLQHVNVPVFVAASASASHAERAHQRDEDSDVNHARALAR